MYYLKDNLETNGQNLSITKNKLIKRMAYSFVENLHFDMYLNIYLKIFNSFVPIINISIFWNLISYKNKKKLKLFKILIF